MISMYEDLAEPTAEKIEAWHLIIGSLTYAECERAVIGYYKHAARRIWPADIYESVHDEREQWFMSNSDFGPGCPHLQPPWQARELEA